MKPTVIEHVDDVSAIGRDETIAHYLDGLLGAAAGARLQAEHYGGFNVGASVLAMKETHDGGDVAIYSGWNRKLRSGHCPERRCAELHCIGTAFEQGFKKVLAVAINAPPRADKASGVNLGVLICCGSCRNSFRHLIELNLLVDGSVQFFFQNADTGKIVPLTMGQLFEVCGGANDNAIYTLGTPVIELLQKAGRSP